MAHRRLARTGLQLLACGALLASLVMVPATAAARQPSPRSNGHTTAPRIATVEPSRIGVDRRAAGGGSALGVPTIAGGGAGALRALRRPGAVTPKRFNLPRWLPQRAAGTRSRATVGNVTAGTALRTPAPMAATANASPETGTGVAGLRSDQGVFGLADSDDSLLYADCSPSQLCEEPPDPGIAVSATNVVQTVNELTMILDRATDQSRVVPNFDFFALDNNQVTQSDPRVIFDTGRGRWVATEISSDCGHGYLHIAVSASDDPFGTWTVYRVVFPNVVVDFPGVGTSNDTVIVSLNQYSPDPESRDCLSPGDFVGGMLVVVDWSDLVGRVASLPVTTTPPDPTLFTWRPALAGSGDPLGRLVVAIDNGSDDTSDVGYATLSGTNGTHDVTLSPVVNLTRTQGLAPFATPPEPRQPGKPATIENAVDGQPTDALAAGGHLWFIATAPCTPAGDDAPRDCVRLTELLMGGSGDVSVVGDTRLQEPRKDLFMGGVARALDGTIYVAYSRSSADDAIAGWATWRAPTDPAFHDPSLIIPTGGTYDGTRWGDYVILSSDPAVPNAVWQGNEVPTVDGSWFTWLSQIRPAAGGSLDGTITLDGGDRFTAGSFVDIQVATPTDVAVTVVRVANDPTVVDGVLSGGLTLPVAQDLPWSLDIDQPNDEAPDGERTVYVQWGDGKGHWSHVASDSIILDKTGPTIGAIQAPLVGLTSLGPNAAVPIDLHWGGGRDALSGLEGYDVEVSRDDGDWEDFASVNGTSATGRVAQGHVYAWRVRSFDRLGNVSTWVETKPVRVSIVDDASASLHYSTGWRRSSTTSAYRGGTHVARVAGASASVSFSGSSFAVVGAVGPGRGTVVVLVDGLRVGGFTETSIVSAAERIGFRWKVGAGRHTVTLVAADNRRIDLDGVILLR